jgi:hypothetical protein
MGRKKARKRRLAICAVFALAVAIGAPLIAPSAGAVIANPGEFQVSLELSVYTPTFTLAGMSTKGSGPAEMGNNGLLKIPKSSLDFQPVNVSIDLPAPVDTTTTGDPATSTTASPPGNVATTATVRAVPLNDFLGGVDPRTGAGVLIGDIQELWTVPGRMTDCPVGPFRINAGTTTSGSVLYSVKTGSVSLVDPGFTIGAIPTGASGCAGLEGAVNSALALPVTTTTTTTARGATPTPTPRTDQPPVPSVVVTMTFTPAPRALPPAPVQHRPPPVVHHVTTTTAAPTVVAPNPNGSQPTSTHHRHQHRRNVQHNDRNRNKKQRSQPIKKPLGAGLLARSGIKPLHRRHAVAHPAVHTKTAANPAAAAAGTGAINPDLVPASFIRRPQSALSTGLDLLGLLALLVFSSLALWLLTSELTDFKAGATRLRTHRIAGITKR